MKLIVATSDDRCRLALEEFAAISNGEYRKAISAKRVKLFMKVFRGRLPKELGMTVEGNNILNMPFVPPSPGQIMEVLSTLAKIGGKKIEIPKSSPQWQQKLLDTLGGALKLRGIAFDKIAVEG